MKLLNKIPTWCIWTSFVLFATGAALGIIYNFIKLMFVFKAASIGYSIGTGLANIGVLLIVVVVPALCMIHVALSRHKN